jgi:hypothetical protein
MFENARGCYENLITFENIVEIDLFFPPGKEKTKFPEDLALTVLVIPIPPL